VLLPIEKLVEDFLLKKIIDLFSKESALHFCKGRTYFCHSHVGRTAPGPSVRQSHGLTVRRYGFCTKMSHSIKNALSMLAPRSDWGSMHDCLLASYWQRQSFTLKLLGSFAAASGGRRRDRSVKIRLFLCQWVVHDKCANWMRDLRTRKLNHPPQLPTIDLGQRILIYTFSLAKTLIKG